uniref:Uncharacterized protein n=1 Tax=Ananas comosus var. bracteatus TaxID=296719 RepID=A0A6V7Q619_ANACO|nr:unnamed protein product [Ananas comosus var. bracteatus]
MWLLLFIGMEKILAHDNNSKYIGGHKKLSGIPVDITFTEFKRKIYRLTDTPRDEMLNCDINVDILIPGLEREPFRADIGEGANAPREYEFSNIVVGNPPPLPRTIHHATASSSHAPLGREQGVSCEEGFHTSHDVHDFGSYPLGTENDGIGNRAEVQQEVAEDGYATDHEGVDMNLQIWP